MGRDDSTLTLVIQQAAHHGEGPGVHILLARSARAKDVTLERGLSHFHVTPNRHHNCHCEYDYLSRPSVFASPER